MRRYRNFSNRWVLLVILGAIAISIWVMRYRESRPPGSIEELMRREGIAGAVLALRSPGGATHLRVVGRAASSNAGPLHASTRFPIASLSKPVTAAAVRVLVKQDRFGLEDRVFELLPELVHIDDARYGEVTVRQLLQHTSGLSQLPGDPMVIDGVPVGCEIALEKTLQRRLDSRPGARMHYSNAGYCLLGRLIEHSAGKDYVDAVRELLELPMDSGLTLGPPPSGVLREGHSLTDNTWVRISSAGGWFSDAETLASLFSRDARDSSIATMTTAPHNDSYYGLGWRVWPQGETYRLTHFGSLPGMFSVAVAYPDGCTAVMLLNDRPKNNEAFAESLYAFLDTEIANVEACIH